MDDIRETIGAMHLELVDTGNVTAATCLLAVKSLYGKLQDVQGELAREEELVGDHHTLLVQLSSVLFVRNKRRATRDDLLKQVEMAQSMIETMLGYEFDTRPMEAENA